MWYRATVALFASLMLCAVTGTTNPGVAQPQERMIVRPYLAPPRPVQMGFPAQQPLKRPRVALVLSGGGARGAAQIGVLKVFERHHVPIDFIVATSMGAIVGGLYASGYSAAEIERLTLTTDWDEVLSLGDETKRTELFIEQKLIRDRNFLAVRFQGLEPVIPGAVSSGQRLTDFLSNQALQALYHPFPTFDELKIPFRAVATDLLSGTRVVMGDGSLAEAVRASATTPLLFDPIEKDTMRLIDGGLLANVPVDVAREAGYDIVIAVNTTSGLRTSAEMRAPWETVDQLMGITMQSLNNLQLQHADVVITPNIGRHLSYDMRNLDTLITHGEWSAEEKLPDILRKVAQAQARVQAGADTARSLIRPSIVYAQANIPDSLRGGLASDSLSVGMLRQHLARLYATGGYRDAWADVETDSAGTRVTIHTVTNYRLQGVDFRGATHVPPDSLAKGFVPFLGRVIDHEESVAALESVLREYRVRGYSLARIVEASLDTLTGILHVVLNEGIIRRVAVEGGIRTKDAFVLREFPLQSGDVFQIEKANRGISNINSTTLFEYVYLEVTYAGGEPVITIRLRERPTQLVRLGMRADNERHLQGSIDFRDENFHGSATELGFTADGGDRNSSFVLQYKIHRLFDAFLTFSASLFYQTYNTNVFADVPGLKENRWDRERVAEYQDVRYGASLAFGSQLERLGNATVELTVQNVRLRNLENAEALREKYHLAMLRAGSVVDSKDSYPFPSHGVGLDLSYEFALDGLGSEVAYNALRIMYESYATWGGRHTLHPRFTMGFADKTMPLSQQFRLGGQETFYGLHEDDQRGRQLLLFNLEYRYLLPVKVLFDTYLRFRYDLGSISAVPEDIKFTALRHGVGAELAFRTPVGPASLGAGKSFFLSKDLPSNPVQQGPLLFYFVIGYQL